ncbi:hypothetical protein K505DRAFT_255736 [Melanomma pulvis-pyrius CBS 109.77]|uniref:RBR-type E3 ubiquitin transferase n=1 Tax=Melanomma pulvis-pyrius CBS 109.77 TaxID=1314802 RepID=A0A6A6WVX3_9PLEO|nr:hypothetical protein K505DRAFT_255736 [Melanomma pulvis-pyrius CBS 109.77]
MEPANTCNICSEVYPTEDTLALVCDHTYCRSCLTDHFRAALVDTGLFPPRCCKTPIPVEICHALLPKDLVKDFDLKVEELAHPNPTYCSNLDCNEFIRLKDIKNDVGTCVFCETKTCVTCKGEQHEGLCPKDPHVVLLMDTAKRSKWQQCSRCKTLVELNLGCFHMTCTCKHQFCYICGVEWKTCRCPQWDEEYLTRNDPNPREPVPAAIPVAAPALVQALARPPCFTHSWRRNNRRRVCQFCGAHWLPYLFECDDCRRLSCWRCIQDRE